MNWQVQEAKQRFSEVLRAVQAEGPQTITRHGKEIAVVVDIDEYRRLAGPKPDFKAFLMGAPFDDEISEVLDEIVAARQHDVHREIDFGLDE
jgi:prevent-host-death family protein